MRATSATAMRTAAVSLPSDLLLDVSERNHEVGDFVRFHAVCRAWRDTAAATRPVFLPWVITPSDDVGRIWQYTIDFGSVYSKVSSSHCYIAIAKPPGASPTSWNWVPNADGTTASLLEAHPEPRLVDLFTGMVTLLPPFPRAIEYFRGIVYGDGTVFLYTYNYEQCQNGPHGNTLVFHAAILRPDDATWTAVEKRLDLSIKYRCSTTYHNGEILVFVGPNIWCVITPEFEANSSDIHRMLQKPWHGIGERMDILGPTYVLVSRGELLTATVRMKNSWQGYKNPEHVLSVTVYALEDADGGRERAWVARDTQSLADRLLFLGSPASFTMEATQLGVRGGYVFFPLGCGMFSYNLVNGEAKCVKRLCSEWPIENLCVWLQPQPAIAPIHEIKERINPGHEEQKL